VFELCMISDQHRRCAVVPEQLDGGGDVISDHEDVERAAGRCDDLAGESDGRERGQLELANVVFSDD